MRTSVHITCWYKGENASRSTSPVGNTQNGLCGFVVMLEEVLLDSLAVNQWMCT